MTTEEKDNDERVVLTVEEGRIALGLSRGCMYSAIHANEIPHIVCGRRILIPKVAFKRMLEAGKPLGLKKKDD